MVQMDAVRTAPRLVFGVNFGNPQVVYFVLKLEWKLLHPRGGSRALALIRMVVLLRGTCTLLTLKPYDQMVK
jgi:hypothetical protein